MNINFPDETDEERHARVTKILERNSKTPVICISCCSPITEEQPLEQTIHGPYHGFPMSCTEGR